MRKFVWAITPIMLAWSIGSASAGPVVYDARTFGIERDQVRINIVVGERGVTKGTRTPAISSFGMKDEADTLGLGTSFFAWCLDLVRPMEAGTRYDRWNGAGNPFDAPNVLTDIQLARVQAVVDRNFAEVTATDVSTAVQDQRHAAMQLALWEAAYEDENSALSLVDGKFNAAGLTALGSSAVALASGYLDFVLGAVPSRYTLTFLTSDTGRHQDLVSASPIPLPAAAWLLACAMGVLAAASRRRNPAA